MPYSSTGMKKNPNMHSKLAFLSYGIYCPGDYWTPLAVLLGRVITRYGLVGRLRQRRIATTSASSMEHKARRLSKKITDA